MIHDVLSLLLVVIRSFLSNNLGVGLQDVQLVIVGLLYHNMAEVLVIKQQVTIILCQLLRAVVQRVIELCYLRFLGLEERNQLIDELLVLREFLGLLKVVHVLLLVLLQAIRDILHAVGEHLTDLFLHDVIVDLLATILG